MSVEHFEFLVEEPSIEVVLRILLPKIIRNCSFDIHSYQDKNDLLKHLTNRLRGYSKWIPKNWRIVVIVDRDNADCKKLKDQLEKKALEANLKTRTAAQGYDWTVVNRIAEEELEAWYFGDWEAVQKAYPKVSSTIPNKARYRNPDSIKGGTWESLERILQRAGYFMSGLRKKELAKAISKYMVPERNKSHSFQVFLTALCESKKPWPETLFSETL
jgi:integrase